MHAGIEVQSRSMAIKYLTVQDVVWLNLQIVGEALPYDFMKLEEGVFFQYGYGSSSDVAGQAARFLTGFAANAPFDSGNLATAFAGTATFLAMNGYEFDVPESEAVDWLRATRADNVRERVAAAARPIEDFHPELAPDVSEYAARVLARYASAWAEILDPAPRAA